MRVMFTGDWHCGHMAGLTHPDWMANWSPQFDFQKELWDWFIESVRADKPDILVANGDLIDGGKANKLVMEASCAPIFQQCKMAARIIDEIGCKSVYMTNGTAMHTAPNGEDVETQICNEVASSSPNVVDHLYLDCKGWLVDVKHAVGSSSIPHGRGTPLAREEVWAAIKSGRSQERKPDLYIRSHVHYFSYIGDAEYLAMTLPSLQGPTHYGRKFSGQTDLGYVIFDFDKGGFQWKPRLARLDASKRQTFRA